MQKQDLIRKIEIFNKTSPVKIDLYNFGEFRNYLVVQGLRKRITPMSMTTDKLWDHVDTLQNFVREMELVKV